MAQIDLMRSRLSDVQTKITPEKMTEMMTELLAIFKAKNADYGHSFESSLNEFGLVSGVVRLSDKVERLKSLMQREARVDEPLLDTVKDLANYALMTAVWLSAQEKGEVKNHEEETKKNEEKTKKNEAMDR